MLLPSRMSLRSSIAASDADSRFSTLSPEKRRSTHKSMSSPATATKNRPTGFVLVPPVGPMTPVAATARSVPIRRRAPFAISRAVTGDTDPSMIITPFGTPSTPSLTWFAYASTPPRKYLELPDTLVSFDAISPDVHASATETVNLRSFSASATCSTTDASLMSSPIPPTNPLPR